MEERERHVLAKAKADHETATRRLGWLPRLWETSYKHGRRKHRHICQQCRKIINEGEEVVMYRVGRKTRAYHAQHDGELHVDELTMRDVALCHAYPEAQ